MALDTSQINTDNRIGLLSELKQLKGTAAVFNASEIKDFWILIIYEQGNVTIIKTCYRY